MPKQPPPPATVKASSVKKSKSARQLKWEARDRYREWRHSRNHQSLEVPPPVPKQERQAFARWLKGLPTGRWHVSDVDFSRPVICSHCFTEVEYIVRDGRREWLEGAGLHRQRHDCFYPDPNLTESEPDEPDDWEKEDPEDAAIIRREKNKRLATFVKKLPAFVEKVNEVRQKPNQRIVVMRSTGRIVVGGETVPSKDFNENLTFSEVKEDLWINGLWDYDEKEADVLWCFHGMRRGAWTNHVAHDYTYTEFLFALQVVNGQIRDFDGCCADIDEVWAAHGLPMLFASGEK